MGIFLKMAWDLRPAWLAKAVLACAALIPFAAWPPATANISVPTVAEITPTSKLEKAEIQKLIAPELDRFSATSDTVGSTVIPLKASNGNDLKASLSLDSDLQKYISKEFRRYRPDYASAVVINPATGRILSVVDFVRNKKDAQWAGDLFRSASFPAASVFKMVTAAAGIDSGKIEPGFKIPFNGKGHTLYKWNLKNKVNRWTRWPSFEKAFARSYNPVFGKVGIQWVGPVLLQEYADRFGFNRDIPVEIPIQVSKARLGLSEYEIAEVASGFNRRTTLSPLLGAMMAGAVINRGVMMEPFAVLNVENSQGDVVYRPPIKELGRPVNGATSIKLAAMMEKTLTNGTTRGVFSRYRRDRVLKHLYIGGKTGSLSGTEPRGRYDWFVGFAQNRQDVGQTLAFAVMIVNKKLWYVRSAEIAKRFAKFYFRHRVPQRVAAIKPREVASN